MTERERTPSVADRTVIRDPALGVLRYNADLEWWEGDLPGDADAALYVDGPQAPPPEWLPLVRATVAAVTGLVPEVVEFAAGQLLAEHNQRWNDDGEPHTAEDFAEAVSLSSIALRQNGTVEVYLDDGDLFDGRAIVVTLDRDLVPSDAKIGEVDVG